MTPADPTTAPFWLNNWLAGSAKLARLNALNTSPRNVMRGPSGVERNGKVRLRERSRLPRPGPMRIFLPALPRKVAGFGKLKHPSLM